jgi:predicted nucleic acid-binding protein
MRRLTPGHLASATERLDRAMLQLDQLEITDRLVRAAGNLAEQLELRGYDAVHLASAIEAADPDVVLVTRDAALAAAGRQAGLAVAHLAA